MFGEMFVPVGAGARRRHQLLHDRLALGLVAGERRRNVALPLPAPWSARSRPRSRAACPSRSRNAPNAARRRSAPCCLNDQCSFQIQGKLRHTDLFDTSGWPSSVSANTCSQIACDCSIVLCCEAVGLPGRGVAFDQERAHVGRVAVVMRVEGAEIGLHKRLRQRGEAPGGAVPGEFVGGMRNRGAEFPSRNCGAPANSARRRRRSNRSP